jgi:hypothetical protein
MNIEAIDKWKSDAMAAADARLKDELATAKTKEEKNAVSDRNYADKQLIEAKYRMSITGLQVAKAAEDAPEKSKPKKEAAK